MDKLPANLVARICGKLHFRQDYANLCAVNRDIKSKCSLTPTQHRDLFSRFVAEENWDYERAHTWIVRSVSRPQFTTLLFLHLLPQRHHGISILGEDLAEDFLATNRQDLALQIFSAIWWQDTREGGRDVEGGMRVAAMYEADKQRENAIEVLDAIWQSLTVNGRNYYTDNIGMGTRLATMYEASGQPESAIGVLEKIWQARQSWFLEYADSFLAELGMRLAAMYDKNGQKEDGDRIRGDVTSGM